MLLFYVLLVAPVVLGNSDLDSCDGECTCISGTLKCENSNLTVPEAFRMYKITPDYVEVAPKDILEVEYVTAKVNLGNFIPPLRLVDVIKGSYKNGKKHSYYTLLSIDFDDASNGKIVDLLMNIRNVETIVPTSGDVIVLFTTSIPALGSGMHRYGKLLYEQKGPIDVEQLDLYKLSRYPVISNLTKFTKRYHLGNPVAGNLYRTELRRCDSSDKLFINNDSENRCQKICKDLEIPNCGSNQVLEGICVDVEG